MTWRLGEILIKKRWISWEQLEEALQEQESTREYLGEILVRKKYLAKSLLFGALAEQHHMRFADLSRLRINPRAVSLIPRSVAQKYHFIPIDVHEGVLYLGVASPVHAFPEIEICQIARVKGIQTVLCLPEDVDQMIATHYGDASRPDMK